MASYLNAHAKELFIDEVMASRELRLKLNNPLEDRRTPDIIAQLRGVDPSAPWKSISTPARLPEVRPPAYVRGMVNAQGIERQSIIGASAALGAALVAALAVGGCGTTANAQTPSRTFTLSSPDLVGGTFSDKFVLNGFGCAGQNVSPALQWSNVPAGTKSLALQVYDPDAPTGSGFWHWAIYDIPADAIGLTQGAGNAAANLPAGAFGGNNDYLDTGATGSNGNYGGPCPPAGDAPHRYVFTLYALAIDKLELAGGVPKTGTAGLYGFVLNKGVGPGLLGKATFTAKYGR